MKRAIIVAACFLTLAACKKKNNQNPTPGGSNNNQLPNKVTLVINGTTYNVEGASKTLSSSDVTQVTFITTKDDGEASVVLHVLTGREGTKPAFNISAVSELGNGTGVGTYQLKYADLTENFSGGEDYDNGTGSITVTHNSPQQVKGTIDINVTNSNGSKNIKGSFNITDVD